MTEYSGPIDTEKEIFLKVTDAISVDKQISQLLFNI